LENRPENEFQKLPEKKKFLGKSFTISPILKGFSFSDLRYFFLEYNDFPLFIFEILSPTLHQLVTNFFLHSIVVSFIISNYLLFFGDW
jgi:hypothetical protein